MQLRNVIVPVVGNFAGPKAIRAVGTYLKEHNAIVSAFYLSNVEQYLYQQNDDWSRFYTNVSMLPLDASSTFIRSSRSGTPDFGFELVSELGSMATDLTACSAP